MYAGGSFCVQEKYNVSLKFDHRKSFPSPTPYAHHTLTPSSSNSKLSSLLIPGNFTVTLSENEPCIKDTRAPGTPPCDVSAFSNCTVVLTSLPSAIKTRTWFFVVAAIRLHGPFPPWGSEKSKSWTQKPVLLLISLHARIVYAAW